LGKIGVLSFLEKSDFSLPRTQIFWKNRISQFSGKIGVLACKEIRFFGESDFSVLGFLSFLEKSDISLSKKSDFLEKSDFSVLGFLSFLKKSDFSLSKKSDFLGAV
jgi:hypothetical protein